MSTKKVILFLFLGIVSIASSLLSQENQAFHFSKPISYPFNRVSADSCPFGFQYSRKSDLYYFEGGIFADYNHDKLLDYVGLTSTTETPAGRLIVFAQSDSGFFNMAREYYGEGATNLDVGDINGDGLFDIVTNGPNHPGMPTLNIYYQSNDGDFDRVFQFYPGKDPSDVRIGDLNNDGLPDIAVSFYGEPDIRVFYQNKDHTFDTNNVKSYAGATALTEGPIKIVDLNKDGLNDLVVLWGHFNDSTFGVYLQQTDGTLKLNSIHSWPTLCTVDFAIGDFNDDGWLDLALPGPANRPEAHVAVFLHDDKRIFSDTGYVYYTWDCPTNLAVGDFDNDGRTDLVSFHLGWMCMTYFHQSATGLFDPWTKAPFDYFLAPRSRRVDVGDVNGDGKLDIVLADDESGMTVLYNTSQQSTIVRHNNSEVITSYFLSQNYPNPFNPSTKFQYSLPTRSHVRLCVYNILGQMISDLVDEDKSAGWNEVIWNANVASGLYFYRLEAISVTDPGKRFVDVKKMILLK